MTHSDVSIVHVVTSPVKLHQETPQFLIVINWSYTEAKDGHSNSI